MLGGLLAILRRAKSKSDHDELGRVHDDAYCKWELRQLLAFAAELGVGGPVEQAAVACHLTPSGLDIPARNERWFSQVADEGRVGFIIAAMDSARVTNNLIAQYLPSPGTFRGVDGTFWD